MWFARRRNKEYWKRFRIGNSGERRIRENWSVELFFFSRSKSEARKSHEATPELCCCP